MNRSKQTSRTNYRRWNQWRTSCSQTMRVRMFSKTGGSRSNPSAFKASPRKRQTPLHGSRRQRCTQDVTTLPAGVCSPHRDKEENTSAPNLTPSLPPAIKYKGNYFLGVCLDSGAVRIVAGF